MNIQRAKTITMSEFIDLSEAEKREVEIVKMKISVAYLLNGFFEACRRECVKPIETFANMDVDEFIQQGKQIPSAIVERIKKEMCLSMIAMAMTGNMDRVYSVELSENGKYSFLTEAGELA